MQKAMKLFRVKDINKTINENACGYVLGRLHATLRRDMSIKSVNRSPVLAKIFNITIVTVCSVDLYIAQVGAQKTFSVSRLISYTERT